MINTAKFARRRKKTPLYSCLRGTRLSARIESPLPEDDADATIAPLSLVFFFAEKDDEADDEASADNDAGGGTDDDGVDKAAPPSSSSLLPRHLFNPSHDTSTSPLLLGTSPPARPLLLIVIAHFFFSVIIFIIGDLQSTYLNPLIPPRTERIIAIASLSKSEFWRTFLYGLNSIEQISFLLLFAIFLLAG